MQRNMEMEKKMPPGAKKKRKAVGSDDGVGDDGAT